MVIKLRQPPLQSMILWDTETGVCIQSFMGHTDSIGSVVFSPEGNLAVSASDDKTLRLWSTSTGQCLTVVQGFRGIRNVAWGTQSDANHLIAGFEDGSVAMWQMIDDDGCCNVKLLWRASTGVLTVMDVSIQDVQGLSPLNRQLLGQRGAVGEPIHHF